MPPPFGLNPTISLPPSHAAITAHLASHLPPPDPSDVPWHHHRPRLRAYNPELAMTSHVVLSITPTPAFHAALSAPPRGRSPAGAPLAFLHRPWGLDRAAVPRMASVLASHKGFDDALTVGWNVALAQRLALHVGDEAAAGAAEAEGWTAPPPDAGVVAPPAPEEGETAPPPEAESGTCPPEPTDGIVAAGPCVCIRGYKKDSERRIGLVARPRLRTSMREMVRRVREEFRLTTVDGTDGGGWLVGREDGKSMPPEEHKGVGEEEEQDGDVDVVAIMNAFDADTVARVVRAAASLPRASSAPSASESSPPRPPPATPPPPSASLPAPASHHDRDCVSDSILYVTGAPRPPGLAAARAAGNMSVLAVGHRACEEWGIRHLARCVRDRWPGLEVVEVFEEERAEEVEGMVGKERPPAKRAREGQEVEQGDGVGVVAAVEYGEARERGGEWESRGS